MSDKSTVHQGVTAGEKNIRLPLPPAALTEPLTTAMQKFLLGPVLSDLKAMMQAYAEEHKEEFRDWMLELPEVERLGMVEWVVKLTPELKLTMPWKRRITDGPE